MHAFNFNFWTDMNKYSILLLKYNLDIFIMNKIIYKDIYTVIVYFY